MFFKCLCCGKPLSKGHSMEIGYGDICRMKMKINQVGKKDMFQENKPDYAILLSNEQFLVIEDLDLGNMSVTNGIAIVISELSKEYDLSNLNIIYKDSSKVFDAIFLNNDCTFSKFAPIGSKNITEAIDTFKTKYL